MINFLRRYSYSYFILSALILSITMWYLQTLHFLGFIFLVPVLFYLDKVKVDIFNKREAAGEFLRMFLFGFLFSTISTLHFFSTFPLDWTGIYSPYLSFFIILLVWLAFGVMMALPMGVWGLSIRLLHSKNIFITSLIGASMWGILEYIRSWGVAIALYGEETLFGPHHTYYSLAHTVAHIPILKELIPVGGIYLASFVIILINYSLYYLFFSSISESKKNSRNLFFSLLLIFGLILGSYFLMKSIRKESILTVDATVVNTYVTDSPDSELNEDEQIDLIESTLNERSSIIIVPESTPLILQYLMKSMDTTEKGKNPLIIGSYTGGGFRNLVFFENSSRRVVYQHKQLLMPIGEYDVTWLRGMISFFSDSWFEKYERAIPSIKKGDEVIVFKHTEKNELVVGGFLCSENISPHLYREATKNGATLLVNLSSRSPFRGSELLSRQSVSVNTLRALENGRYVVVASNYDKSYVLDDKGVVQNMSGGNERYSHFNSKIKLQTYTTPYVKYGDYFLLVALVFIVLRSLFVLRGFSKNG